MGDRLLRILAGPRARGRCRYCGLPVEWAVAAPHGKNVPLNPDPLVLSATCNAQTHLKFLVVSANHLHFATCQKRPTRPPKPRAHA